MVYNYTIPRRPIAAMFKSPGPIYVLPGLTGHSGHDTRSVHRRGPAPQFGVSLKSRGPDNLPAPNAYFPNPKIQRYGHEYNPQFSVYSKLKGITPFNNPGPGTFDPHHNFTSLEYSMARRLDRKILNDTPGPDKYFPPGPCEGPHHVCAQRLEHGSYLTDYAKAPAPGTYELTDTSRYKYRYPEFSIYARTEPPRDRNTRPAPGSHYPERVILNKPIPPKYSFGIRHSEYTAPLIVSTID